MANSKVPVTVVRRENAAGVVWVDENGNHCIEKGLDDGPGVMSIGPDGTRYKDDKLVWSPPGKET